MIDVVSVIELEDNVSTLRVVHGSAAEAHSDLPSGVTKHSLCVRISFMLPHSFHLFHIEIAQDLVIFYGDWKWLRCWNLDVVKYAIEAIAHITIIRAHE